VDFETGKSLRGDLERIFDMEQFCHVICMGFLRMFIVDDTPTRPKAGCVDGGV